MPSMRRSFWFWVCFCVAIVLAIYFISRTIMIGMGHGNLARIHKTSIIADVENKDMSSLSAAAALPTNTPLYTNLDDINTRISSVPGVKHSAVRRLPNSNLVIHVSYHHLIAAYTDGESYYPISDDGTKIDNPSDIRPESAVLFRGAIPKNKVAEITAALNDMLNDIDYVEWIENRRLDIHTVGGITIQLPENDYAQTVARLININKNHNILGRDIQIIDMRDPARILVK